MDLAPGAVEAARRRTPPGADARFVVADAAALPADDGAFDAVLLLDMLEHVESTPAVLAEASRVRAIVRHQAGTTADLAELDAVPGDVRSRMGEWGVEEHPGGFSLTVLDAQVLRDGANLLASAGRHDEAAIRMRSTCCSSIAARYSRSVASVRSIASGSSFPVASTPSIIE